MAGTVKLSLRVPTFGVQAGEEIEVDSDQADALVANGSAWRATEAQSAKKSSK